MVYPNRYSTTGVRTAKGGVVVHDSEGGEGGSSCEQLISFMEQPGTRIIDGSNPPRYYGSSYHAVADEDGSYRQVLGAGFGPFAAPPLNKTWWHVVIPGKAAQSRAQWLDAASRPYITAVAKFIVDKSKIDGFPCVKVGPVGLRNATTTGLHVGYCGHVDVTAAWHDTDHTDPGGFFPWDVLAADIEHLLHPPPPPPPPPQEDDMAELIKINDGDSAIFASLPGGVMRWMPTWDTINLLAFDGQFTNPIVNGRPVPTPKPRALLNKSILVGPLPAYPPGWTPARTTSADFQAVVA